MSDSEKSEIINNALEAGPTIPFPNFSKLFKTWLEVLCTISEENRHDMFSNYIKHIIKSPQKIIAFLAFAYVLATSYKISLSIPQISDIISGL